MLLLLISGASCSWKYRIKSAIQISFVFPSQSKWTGARSPCDVKTIVAEDCFSVGDALREIDRQVWMPLVLWH